MAGGLPPSARPFAPERFARLLEDALRRRKGLVERCDITAYRVLDGAGDGMRGVFVDRYGPALVIQLHEDAGLSDTHVTSAARAAWELLRPSGVESVYVKPFVRDRSRLGGHAPAETRAAVPRVGRPQPEVLVVREYDWQFEVRLYDGFSTGLFLEHREHRQHLVRLGSTRVLNLFAYTCAFAVPLVAAGAQVTNVDVSARYLAWGRRNLALNALAPDRARLYRMDAFEFLAFAARRQVERFDLVILDPPTFAASGHRRGARPWKAIDHYPALIEAARRVLADGGAMFAATNARELARPGVLRATVQGALGRPPTWLRLPSWPPDVTERGRVAAALFVP